MGRRRPAPTARRCSTPTRSKARDAGHRRAAVAERAAVGSRHRQSPAIPSNQGTRMRALSTGFIAPALWLSAAVPRRHRGCWSALQLGGRILDGALELVGVAADRLRHSLAGRDRRLSAGRGELPGARRHPEGRRAHPRHHAARGAGRGMRRGCEIWAFAAAAAFSGLHDLAARPASPGHRWQFNEVSPGLIPVQLVYPQAAMALGARHSHDRAPRRTRDRAARAAARASAPPRTPSRSARKAEPMDLVSLAAAPIAPAVRDPRVPASGSRSRSPPSVSSRWC